MVELYALKYGESEYPERFVYDTKLDSNHQIEFAWLFYLIKYNGKNILVDTGFSDHLQAVHYAVLLHEPVILLSQLDVTPDDIDIILLTHAHYDHMGDLNRYHRAEVYMSQREADDYFLLGGNTAVLKQVKESGRLHLFEKSIMIEEHFLFKWIGGHTPGSAALYFKNEGHYFVLAGDEAYLFDNIERQICPGTIYDRERTALFLSELKNSNATILTFHEPSIVPEGAVIRRLL